MSELRPIAALHRGGLTPAAIAPRPRLEWIPLGDLRVDGSYQRQLSERSVTLIRRIVEGWDWARVKPLSVVSLPDGTFEVLDGQHTATAAATHGGIDALPCLVAPDRSKAEKAATFVGLNRDRVAMTPLATFWAQVEAGDPVAVATAEGAAGGGLSILRKPAGNGVYRSGDTVAVASLRAIATRKGAPGVKRAAQICAAAKLAPAGAVLLAALAHLLWSREYSGEVPDARIAAIIRTKGWSAIEASAKARRAQTGTTLTMAVAQIIYGAR